MKSFFNSYMADLNFELETEGIHFSEFKHNKKDHTLVIFWQDFGTASIEEARSPKERDHLFIVTPEQVETIGYEVMEGLVENLPSNVSVTLYEEDTLEHTMKDIWFFLNRKR